MSAVAVEAKPVPFLHRVTRIAAERLVPLQVALELTYRCNLRCAHCYVDSELRRGSPNELSTSEWLGVLDQLEAAGTLYLLLTGGEVLTRPDFFDIAQAARRRRFRLVILTNGTLVDAEVARRFKALEPGRVGTSLYGATRETHEALTGRRGSFAATIQGIRHLVANNLSVAVQVTGVDRNIHEAEAVEQLIRELGASPSLSYSLAPTKACALSPQQLEASEDALAALLQSPLMDRPTEPDRKAMGLCKAGRCTCSISPTGDVFPCLLMPLAMGNLREQGFATLWRTRPAEGLTQLRSMTAADLDECAGCALAGVCRRCPGVALSETGSLTGCSPSACRYASARARQLGVKGERSS